MKKVTTDKYDKLSDRVLALNYSSARALLCFLMGYCEHDEHFLAGVESGLALYSSTGEGAVKEGKV